MDAPRQEAAAWHMRRRSGLSPTEAVRFDRWLAEPDNAAAFRQIEIGWDSFDLADEAEVAAIRARTRLRVRRRRMVSDAMKIAATLVVAVGGAAVYASQTGELHENNGARPMPVELADGSRLVLDAQTRVRVRFSRDARRIELQRGQASFDVAHDASRPFSVSVGPATATAVGTHFNIDRWNDDATITLFEGVLDVAAASSWPGAGDAPARLGAGQQVTVRSKRISPVTPAQPAAVSAWEQGNLVFSDVSLDQAVAGVNRYGGPPITLADPALGRLRISGIFRAGDPESFSKGVARLHGLKVATGPEGISLLSQN
jgi:transmembrane sensor